MRSRIMQNIKKTFLVRKFEPNPRYPTVALDYTRYGISVENPLQDLHEISIPWWKTPSHIHTHG